MLWLAFTIWWLVSYPLLTWLRPHRVGAHMIVLDDQERVLLVRQTYRSGWFLPGGGVDRRETLHDAAVRETYEETGVIAEEGAELLGAYTHLNKRYTDHMAVYVLRRWRRVTQSSLEIAETQFFAQDALPADIGPGLRRRLAELRGAVPRSSVWNPDQVTQS